LNDLDNEEPDTYCEDCESEECICDTEEYDFYIDDSMCPHCRCDPCQCDAQYDAYVDRLMFGEDE